MEGDGNGVKRQMAETVVIGLNWVGDNVLALPTYRALHHRFRSEGGIATPSFTAKLRPLACPTP